MKNNVMLLKQTFNNTIQNIDKTLGTNLLSRLSKKTIFIVSAIAAFVIASIATMYKIERKIAERNFIKKEYILGDFVEEDIVRISRIKFNKLDKFAKEKLNIDLSVEDCTEKCINVYFSCRHRVYPVVSAIYNARNNINHPFHGKDLFGLEFIYSDKSPIICSDKPLFDAVKDCSPSRLANSIVATREMLNNKLLDIAEEECSYKPEVSKFYIDDYSDLSKSNDFKGKVFRMGRLNKFIYVAHRKGVLSDYKEYVIESITRENK